MAATITEDQQEIIDCLSDPRTYGGGVTTVERIDTHSAVVFLAGERAYKLKRAVLYSFLDFSTLERRRAACEAEVRLNRRTAPDLYLGALPISRERDGSLALGGSGDPVDWVVHMVRFDSEGLFDKLAARGALGLDLMAPLAAVIKRLHATAERRADQGGIDGMSWVVEGNARDFIEHGSGVFDQDQAARLSSLTRATLLRHEPLLERRRHDGYVRVCHGDLHLRNIVLIDGRPTLFDAVEFSDLIACVDVLYDVAFLLMDLWRLRLSGHANELMNAYVASPGDIEGLSLLPLFLSCRSAVRAKTSAAAAALQPNKERAAELVATARAYLASAESLLQPPPPRLIAVGGRSGSGKSSLARLVAPAIGAAPGALILRSDVMRKGLFDVAPTTRLDAGHYDRSVSDEVYRVLGERAAVALGAGHSVIVDATFLDAIYRSALERVAAEARKPFIGLWLDAPADTLMARVRSRKIDASDATAEVLTDQLSRDCGKIEWTFVDASGTPEDVRARAMAVLSRTHG
jgi:aminoglycoside phosphotransferase family enzyme/predicted kinase